MTELCFTVHDEIPSDLSAIVDQGLGEANEKAAPLHEVEPLSCFARSESETGTIQGGAVGRRWGTCCELQQLWVRPESRGKGIGSKLLANFEAHAKTHGCTTVILETFSFQSPKLYRKQGYQVDFERTGYPHKIVKFHMHKELT